MVWGRGRAADVAVVVAAVVVSHRLSRALSNSISRLSRERGARAVTAHLACAWARAHFLLKPVNLQKLKAVFKPAGTTYGGLMTTGKKEGEYKLSVFPL